MFPHLQGRSVGSGSRQSMPIPTAQRALREPGLWFRRGVRFRCCYPDVSFISWSQNSIIGFEGENDRYKVRFVEAIQTVVSSEPNVSFAVLENRADNVVA